MSNRPMLTPSDQHPITITANPHRVVVSLAGQVLADTRHALTLKEAAYPPVQYIPRHDVNMSLLERTDHATHCPYKGEANYFSIPLGGARGVNAVWTYEAASPAVKQIEGHLAFYTDRVSIKEE